MSINRSVRGFTIVELAIVLVVIGIILGMAVKGKALVDAARMRAEVAKINKFEAAVSVYFAKHNGELPGYSNNGQPTSHGKLMPNLFISEGLLTKADFDEKIDNLDWAIFLCRPSDAGNSWLYPANATAYAGINICILTVPDGQVDVTNIGSVTGMGKRLSCNIEIMKDDENRSTGSGRGFSSWGGNDTDVDRANYANCDNYTNAEISIYAFKVF